MTDSLISRAVAFTVCLLTVLVAAAYAVRPTPEIKELVVLLAGGLLARFTTGRGASAGAPVTDASSDGPEPVPEPVPELLAAPVYVPAAPATPAIQFRPFDPVHLPAPVAAPVALVAPPVDLPATVVPVAVLAAGPKPAPEPWSMSLAAELAPVGTDG